MAGNISNLILKYKEKGKDEESVLKIIEKFNPLINKYAKKFPYCEYEDVCQELVLAIIDAINNILKYDNEGQCVNYIVRAIKLKFLELYRKEKRKEKFQLEIIPLIEENMTKNHDLYKEIELVVDLEKIKSVKNKLQSEIAFLILLEGLSDLEIAEKLNISRQYVNRCKKEIFRGLKEYNKN